MDDYGQRASSHVLPIGSRRAPRWPAAIALAVEVVAIGLTVYWRNHIFDHDLSLRPTYAILLAGYGIVVLTGLAVPWLARRNRRVWLALLSLPALALAAVAAAGFVNNYNEYRDLERLRDRLSAAPSNAGTDPVANTPSQADPTFTAAPVPKGVKFKSPNDMLAAIQRAGFDCAPYDKPSADNTGAIAMSCVHGPQRDTYILSVYPTAAVQKENSFGEGEIRQGDGWGIFGGDAATADRLFAILKKAASGA